MYVYGSDVPEALREPVYKVAEAHENVLAEQ